MELVIIKWDKAVNFWKTLPSDLNATYDKEVFIKGNNIVPQVTWGTSPQDVIPVHGKIPDPKQIEDINRRKAMERSLEYMGLEPNQNISDVY